MSTVTHHIPHAQALADATAFRELFEGTYERWEFAGSLRRSRTQVGDVDHVIIPAEGEMEFDLIGEPVGRPNLFRRRLLELIDLSVVIADSINGERRNTVRFRGRKHELYLCWPDNWGCTFAIRTGSGEFSKGLVTRLRAHGHRQFEGHLYRRTPGGQCQSRFNTEIEGEWCDCIPCPDEDTYFKAAGLNLADWPPHKREGTP